MFGNEILSSDRNALIIFCILPYKSYFHYVQLVKKKEKKNIFIYFNTNYRTKMKQVQIIMDYCLLQFDALIFFLGVHLHVGSQPNFNSFNVNPQIFQRNHKVHLTICLETNFHDISIISLRVIRRRNYI